MSQVSDVERVYTLSSGYSSQSPNRRAFALISQWCGACLRRNTASSGMQLCTGSASKIKNKLYTRNSQNRPVFLPISSQRVSSCNFAELLCVAAFSQTKSFCCCIILLPSGYLQCSTTHCQRNLTFQLQACLHRQVSLNNDSSTSISSDRLRNHQPVA